jgi:chaperonin GroES
MESTIKPKFGRVLIKRELKEKTTGGIIIPDAKRHSKCEGKILALGETAGLLDGGEKILKVGDNVIFGRHSGAWLDSTFSGNVESDDGTLFICQDADILAVIEEQ